MNPIPTVTKNILVINVLLFLATWLAPSYGINLEDYLGLHFFLADKFNASQLVTYMFMHGGFPHLFFNMFAVWMFGRVLEQVWGPRRFLFYYLICGIGAGLIQLLVCYVQMRIIEGNLSTDAINIVLNTGAQAMAEGKNFVNSQMGDLNVVINGTTVGASGAVYAILLGFGMLFPNERLFIIPIPVPIKAKYFVAGYALIELYLAFLNNPNDNVAHFAHLGGMIFGFFLILYWRKKNRNHYDGFHYQ
ncbi:MAG: rhomboid family intramembrane serine protease [Prevotellaceae bacterium]|jgi:membrane associated rhomboid family serine protease|nr:rhomboid family intramembrane serine protease [Prevotellaceae bacterium]